MEGEENIWIELPKFSQGYISGIKYFIQNAFSIFAVGDEITCPCKNCKKRKWHRQDIIYDHLICSGPSPLYAKWICEVLRGTSDEDMDYEGGTDFGDNLDEMLHRIQNCEDGYSDEANANAKKLYRHVEEGKQPLYPGCTRFS